MVPEKKISRKEGMKNKTALTKSKGMEEKRQMLERVNQRRNVTKY